jgi:hypothetical protein
MHPANEQSKLTACLFALYLLIRENCTAFLFLRDLGDPGQFRKCVGGLHGFREFQRPRTGRQRLISLSGCQLLHLTSTHARYLKQGPAQTVAAQVLQAKLLSTTHYRFFLVCNRELHGLLIRFAPE